MFHLPVRKSLNLRTCLKFQKAVTVKMSNEPAKSTKVDIETPKSESLSDHHISRKHVLSNFERWLFVWTGRYKKDEDVPKAVPIETFEKVRNKARIKLSNYMMFATVVACFGFALSGKRAAERGESVTQMNLDWHKSVKEEYEKSNK